MYPCCQKRISTIHDSRVLESEGWTLFFFGSFFTKMMKIVKRNNSKKKKKTLTPVLLSVFMWLHDYIMWWMLKNEAVGTFPLLVFELAAGDGFEAVRFLPLEEAPERVSSCLLTCEETSCKNLLMRLWAGQSGSPDRIPYAHTHTHSLPFNQTGLTSAPSWAWGRSS